MRFFRRVAVLFIFVLISSQIFADLSKYEITVEYYHSIRKKRFKKKIVIRSSSALKAIKKAMKFRTRSYYPVDVVGLKRVADNTRSSTFLREFIQKNIMGTWIAKDRILKLQSDYTFVYIIKSNNRTNSVQRNLKSIRGKYFFKNDVLVMSYSNSKSLRFKILNYHAFSYRTRPGTLKLRNLFNGKIITFHSKQSGSFVQNQNRMR